VIGGGEADLAEFAFANDQRANPLRGYNLARKPAQPAAVSAFSGFAQPAVVETLAIVVSGERANPLRGYNLARKLARTGSGKRFFVISASCCAVDA